MKKVIKISLNKDKAIVENYSLEFNIADEEIVFETVPKDGAFDVWYQAEIEKAEGVMKFHLIDLYLSCALSNYAFLNVDGKKLKGAKQEAELKNQFMARYEGYIPGSFIRTDLKKNTGNTNMLGQILMFVLYLKVEQNLEFKLLLNIFAGMYDCFEKANILPTIDIKLKKIILDVRNNIFRAY